MIDWINLLEQEPQGDGYSCGSQNTWTTRSSSRTPVFVLDYAAETAHFKEELVAAHAPRVRIGRILTRRDIDDIDDYFNRIGIVFIKKYYKYNI
jgi:hypothetical protein